MWIKYALTAIAGVIIAAAFIWFIRRNWRDLLTILDALDEPDTNEEEETYE